VRTYNEYPQVSLFKHHSKHGWPLKESPGAEALFHVTDFGREAGWPGPGWAAVGGSVAEGAGRHQICKVMGELGRDYDVRLHRRRAPARQSGMTLIALAEEDFDEDSCGLRDFL
jgi:hypothetical protein